MATLPPTLHYSQKGFSWLPAFFTWKTNLPLMAGWTAIPNLGEDQLSQVIEAYSAVGLPRRADALRRILNAYLASPADEEAEDCYSVAAQDELPDLLDDEEGCAVVLAYLRSDPAALFGTVS